MLRNMFFRFLFVAMLLPVLLESAKILIINPAVSYSHQIAFMPIWTELSLRGHKVTVATTNPQRNQKLVNLTEIDMSWAYRFTRNVTHLVEYKLSPLSFHSDVWKFMGHICELLFASDEVQNLLHGNNTFDLIMIENMCPEFLALAKVYDCPKILFTTMSLTGVYHDILGDSSHPVLHPDFVTPFHGEMSFTERVASTLIHWSLYSLYITSYFPIREKVVQRYFNTSTTTLLDMIKDVDLLFLGTNQHIHGVRAIGPATIMIGGHRKDMSLEPMPVDIKKFLDDAKEGCVFVSLGSNVKSSQLSDGLQKPLIEALSELPYKVLWKYEDESYSMSKNIKTGKWLPQQKILNHPNVKVFLCQGGLQSMEEAIYGEVPFVVLPFFSDQYQNARILKNKGIAIVLNRENLKKDDLKNAITEVMTNPKYREGVKKLKELILDEPLVGVEKAIWWTEYVIRHKGAKHLRNPAADLPFYQYYLLDVISFLLAVVILAVGTIVFTLKKLCKLVASCYKKKEKAQ